MNNNLLTIAEFAERAGVTKQAVYQRLNKDLNKYVKVIDCKKMLDIAALGEFEVKQVEQADSQELNNGLTSTLNTLNSVIDTLRQQLDIKDGQIKDLNNRLEQALNNQSQDNYIMAQQAKTIEGVTVSPESADKPSDGLPEGELVQEPNNNITDLKGNKPVFWKKFFGK